MNTSTLYCVLAVMLALLVFVHPAQVASEEADDKRAGHNIMRFGRGHNIMRFGRAGHNIMHFGKRGDGLSEETSAGYAGSAPAGAQAYGSEYQLPSEQQQALLDTLLSSYNYNKKASDPRDLRERDNVFMHFG